MMKTPADLPRWAVGTLVGAGIGCGIGLIAMAVILGSSGLSYLPIGILVVLGLTMLAGFIGLGVGVSDGGL